MRVSSIHTILQALNRRNVRYVVAGGLAVVVHGYVRFTADVDLLMALDPANLAAAVQVLRELGYQPRAPVDLESLLDERIRQDWIREKGLTVFSLHSDAHPATEIDIVIDPPLQFESAYSNAREQELAPGISARFVSLDDLIAMKRRAGRARDVDDIEHLEKLRGRRS